MGLFSNKQPVKQTVSDDDATTQADQLFDQAYRDELRQIGRDHFRQLIDASASDLKSDIDATMRQVAEDLKGHMMRQLDATVVGVNAEITNQLNQRISEFNRLTSEAQDLATQSLNRNAQAVYEKYQQFSATLQQTIASQEVMMITVFQESKAKAAAVHAEQEKALHDLTEAAAETRAKADQLYASLQQNATDQSAKLDEVYQHNLSQVEQTKRAQDQAIATLGQSVAAIENKHQQLAEMIDQSVAQQKAMLIDTINDNMARIVEHYLIGALGEQSDLKSQLPSILEQMEKNKQAMVEDMKL